MASVAVCATVVAALLSPCTTASLDSFLAPYGAGPYMEGLTVTPARKLLQDSRVCGFNEYFCGDTDMVSDTAYNAVVAGNCYNDTADTGGHVQL